MKNIVSLISLTSFTALFVAICAAVFSVTGIATLFAGAALSAAIMASALELGKLVSISFLYQYWEKIPRSLKGYLLTASVVLMLITSAGIYGYLSAAYAKVAAVPLQLSADIQMVEGRVKTIEQDIDRKNQRLDQLITLRNQQENRLDSLIIRSQSGNNTAIRNAQNGLTQADRNVNQLQQEISTLSATRDSLNSVSIAKNVEIETNGDIGTFVYIAKMFGVSLDTVVKWFTLIIVLVFDPLAVALVVAVNFLLKNKTGKEGSSDLIDQTETSPEPTVTATEEPTEPFKVYVSEDVLPTIEQEQPVIIAPPDINEEEILNKYLDVNNNGVPDWMEPEFDWDNTEKWINNPIARHYKQQVVDKHK